MATDSDFNFDPERVAVPEKARHLAIDELPLTTRLSNVLRRMGCVRLGDLHGLTYSGVGHRSGCGRTTLHELKSLIAELDPSDSPSESASARLVAQPPPFPFSAKRFSVFESERIEVPEQAQDLLISQLLLPTRLGSALRRMGCERLGDLHGRTYADIWEAELCGWTTIWQLKTLIGQLDHADLRNLLKPVDESPVGTSDGSGGAISIPEYARDWPLALMPRSTRLDNVLRKAGFTRLGDLHGLSSKDLRKIKNCGRAISAEIRSLARRAQEGEFDVVFSARSEPDLLSLFESLDRAIGEFSERERQIVLLRFGGTGEPAATLEEIGAKHGLTREGVRQIVNRKLVTILKRGGPIINLPLKKLAEKCLTAVCPLRPETLAHWLGEGAFKLRCALPFYVHLFGALLPEIPVWPHGQRHEESASERSKEIVRYLEEFLQDNPALPSLSDALDWLRRERPALAVQASDLLEALRVSDSPVVEFVDPDRPTLRPAPALMKRNARSMQLWRPHPR